MGETSCTLTVLDVAEALQSGYACMPGGVARNGAPVCIFPDSPTPQEVSDEEYRHLVTYLASIPPWVRGGDAEKYLQSL